MYFKGNGKSVTLFMYAAETVGEQWAEKKIQETNNCVTRARNEFCVDSRPTQD